MSLRSTQVVGHWAKTDEADDASKMAARATPTTMRRGSPIPALLLKQGLDAAWKVDTAVY